MVDGDEERLVVERLASDRNRGFVVAERREEERRAGGAGDVPDRPVEFDREIQRVECVDPVERSGVVSLARFDDVVADESHAVRGVEVVHVGRGHRLPGVDECGGDVRGAADPDFEQCVVAGEASHECVSALSVHVGMFMGDGRLTPLMLVDIVPIGDVPAQVKREASTALRSVYDLDVTVHDEQSIPEGTFDRSRNQYRAEEFIELASRVGSGDKNIGITPHDLFYRRRNYVFGLAYLNGNGSVISTYRLQTSSDGGITTKPQSEVFADRVRKEVVHEIGHTFGLEHCDNSKCVMSFSPTVREVDVKEENLCGTCSRLYR